MKLKIAPAWVLRPDVPGVGWGLIRNQKRNEIKSEMKIEMKFFVRVFRFCGRLDGSRALVDKRKE